MDTECLEQTGVTSLSSYVCDNNDGAINYDDGISTSCSATISPPTAHCDVVDSGSPTTTTNHKEQPETMTTESLCTPAIIAADYQISHPAGEDDGGCGPAAAAAGGVADDAAEFGAVSVWKNSGAADDVFVCTEDPNITFAESPPPASAVPSGTNVNEAATSSVATSLSSSSTLPPSASVEGNDWRQSSSFEKSRGSSATSVETIQSVIRNQPTSTMAMSDDTTVVMATADPSTMTVVESSSIAVEGHPPTTDGDEQLLYPTMMCSPVVSDDTLQPETIEEVKVEEPPRTKFTTGITCCDVPTALDILNTRYRLADVTIHKNMITWSSWNIADMVRGPHRDSFWWKGKRRGRYPLRPAGDSVDKGETPSSTPRENGGTDVSLKDIEVLCDKIELKEKEIELMLQRDEQRQREALSSSALSPVSDETVTVERAPVTSSAPHGGGDPNSDGGPRQQKRENVFQRLLRALRKRFSRQQQQPQAQQQSQSQQNLSTQQQEQKAAHKRQRTL